MSHRQSPSVVGVNLGGGSSERSELSTERSDLRDVQRRVGVMIREIAGPRGFDESRSEMLRRVALASGISETRISDIFYGEARRIDAHEFLNIQAAANKIKARWGNYRVPFPRA